MTFSPIQCDSLARAGTLEILGDGWLKVPGDAGPADLVHDSGLAIFDMQTTVVLVGGELSLELASVEDAMATASALLGR
jgi:hypothetical protein